VAPTLSTLEELTLEVTEEIHVRASPGVGRGWKSLLERVVKRAESVPSTH